MFFIVIVTTLVVDLTSIVIFTVAAFLGNCLATRKLAHWPMIFNDLEEKRVRRCPQDWQRRKRFGVHAVDNSHNGGVARLLRRRRWVGVNDRKCYDVADVDVLRDRQLRQRIGCQARIEFEQDGVGSHHSLRE